MSRPDSELVASNSEEYVGRWKQLFPAHVCSLGYEVIDWIEAYCCHGPGDIEGDPIELDWEWREFIIAAYRLDPVTGRRKVDASVLSRPKGRAKSELAGELVVAEGFGPVRFDGWDANGQPVGRPVRSPLIKCLATEESQAGNTFANVAYIVKEYGQDMFPELYGGVKGARQYQTATSLLLPSGGEIHAVTSGAASKDGGKETFVVADEVHLFTSRELRNMYATISRNLGKRKMAEPWLLATTTMYKAGEMSVAEQIFRQWRKGELPESTLVDHRQATGKVDIADEARTKRQLIEVYGAAAHWTDIDRKYRDMQNPTICPDESTAARYFLNRALPGSDVWIAEDVVERQKKADVVAPGETITIGFDGSLTDDSTVLIGQRFSDGFLFPLGIWERPEGPEGIVWEVDHDEVNAKVDEVFAQYDVIRMYCDPHEWRSEIGDWAQKHGTSKVVEWATNRWVAVDAALDRLKGGLTSGSIFHSGDERFMTHFVNAIKAPRGRLTLVRKPSQERKIDSVIGAALASEARADELADRAKKQKQRTGRVVGF